MLMAKENGRTGIGAPDRLFGVSSKAKERIRQIGKEKVIDSTIGVLLDDGGKLVVLDSVMECIRSLQPEDYAAYAPILGLPEYREAVKKAVFLDESPENVFIESCYTPGGTGAIRNAVSAYTSPGDSILVSDWHWNPYNLIASEIGRKLETYPLFGENGCFEEEAFKDALERVLAQQEQTLVIINTPAHNPTGYTFTEQDWEGVMSVLAGFSGKKIALLTDIAYLDFAGDSRVYRQFLKTLAKAPEHVLPLIAFSASKGYTMYGMRCGALLCMAQTEDRAKEFVDVMSVESRATWSNGNRAAMQVLADILSDDKCLEKVKCEREKYLQILLSRGRAFMKAAEAEGLETCPYDSGFFITVPCRNPELVGELLQKQNIFVIPMGRGIRISVASNTEDECRKMPAAIKTAVNSASAL